MYMHKYTCTGLQHRKALVVFQKVGKTRHLLFVLPQHGEGKGSKVTQLFGSLRNNQISNLFTNQFWKIETPESCTGLADDFHRY